MSSNNPLDPAALLSKLPSLLPETDPTISNPLSAISALLHTTLVSLSFRLLSHSDTPLSPPPSSSVLLESWAAHSPESHTFLYKHPRSSLTYLFKVIKLADRALIHGRSLESPATASSEIAISDYTSASFWPWTKDKEGAEPLVHGFISSSRVNDLVSLWKVGLIGKLAPGLEKEGYEAQSDSNNGQPPPANPVRPRPPVPEPEPDYQLPARFPYAPRNPLEIGRADRDPPGLPPSNPFAPPPMFDPNGGGMFVGPSHPMFGLRDPEGGGNFGPGRPRWGGDGWLPEGAVPPGARFDPIGPGPLPLPGRGGFGPLGGGRFGRGGGRMPPGMGGEPDNDEFLPPGMGDMPPGMRDMFS